MRPKFRVVERGCGQAHEASSSARTDGAAEGGAQMKGTVALRWHALGTPTSGERSLSLLCPRGSGD
jgi:hypothetical protein